VTGNAEIRPSRVTKVTAGRLCLPAPLRTCFKAQGERFILARSRGVTVRFRIGHGAPSTVSPIPRIRRNGGDEFEGGFKRHTGGENFFEGSALP